MKVVLLSFFLATVIPLSFAQKSDTLDYHNPKTAARLSLILPGAGQIYNHRAMPKGKKKAWWKLPLIYGGLGATGYFVVENHILQRDLKAEYIFRAQNGFPNNMEFVQYDNQGVLQLYEAHKSTRDLMLFGFIAVYGLNVLDALVEAHFVDFDVSPDLSLGIRPYAPDPKTPGISLSLRFK